MDQRRLDIESQVILAVLIATLGTLVDKAAVIVLNMTVDIRISARCHTQAVTANVK